MSDLKVGATVYEFDGNARSYVRGRRDYRACWRPRVIVGETRLSWVVGEHAWDQKKIPKKSRGTEALWAFSEDEVRQRVFVETARASLSHRVIVCRDARVLADVARLLGMVVDKAWVLRDDKGDEVLP